jgi:hypothetical protein
MSDEQQTLTIEVCDPPLAAYMFIIYLCFLALNISETVASILKDPLPKSKSRECRATSAIGYVLQSLFRRQVDVFGWHRH